MRKIYLSGLRNFSRTLKRLPVIRVIFLNQSSVEMVNLKSVTRKSKQNEIF